MPHPTSRVPRSRCRPWHRRGSAPGPGGATRDKEGLGLPALAGRGVLRLPTDSWVCPCALALHWHSERCTGMRACAAPGTAEKIWRKVRPLEAACALGVSSQAIRLTTFLDFSRHMFSFSLILYQLLSSFHVSFQVMKFRTFWRNPQISVRSWLKFCFQNTCKSHCVTGKFLVFSLLPLLLFKQIH